MSAIGKRGDYQQAVKFPEGKKRIPLDLENDNVNPGLINHGLLIRGVLLQ